MAEYTRLLRIPAARPKTFAIDQRTGGLTVATEGALAVVGLFLIDAQVDKVDWQIAGT